MAPALAVGVFTSLVTLLSLGVRFVGADLSLEGDQTGERELLASLVASIAGVEGCTRQFDCVDQ